jgi:hypothetical protein
VLKVLRADERLDVDAQAAALLPEFAGDLSRAGEWNRYTIVATIDPDGPTLSGAQRLEYTNRNSVPLDRLFLRLFPNLREFAGRLDVANLAVDGQSLRVAYERERFLLRIDLAQPLAPGATVVATLDFTTRTPVNAAQRAYGAFNLESGVLALASAYPIVAQVRDGVWQIDRPSATGDFVNSDTALYDVTLTVPNSWRLATTGVTIDEWHDGDQRTERIVSGPQRDFVISATQLAQISGEADGTRVHSYYRPGSDSGGKAALQAAINSLQAFNRRYGRYPLAELDVVEIDARRFLGVEYPGLTMIEHKLYTQPDILETTVAHELAHQWWYSLVGNDVQREAWLDEALASYSQIVYREEVQSPQAAENELAFFRQRYLAAVAAGRDAPVEQPVGAFRGNYVALVYGKAVLFFQAMREQIGDEAFDRFLKSYYGQYRYGAATGAGLLATAETACACQLDPLYEDWIQKRVPLTPP